MTRPRPKSCITTFHSNTSSGSCSYHNDTRSSSTTSLISHQQRFSHVQRYSSNGLLHISAPRGSTIAEAYSLFPFPDVPEPSHTWKQRSWMLLEPVRHSHPHFFYQRNVKAGGIEPSERHTTETTVDEALDIKVWQPWALRGRTFISMIFFALACLAALEVLSYLSKREHGIRTWSWEARFAWTVMPHLLFVSAAAIWRQVEYRYKQLTPWRAMSKEPTTANKSVLLNYITPMNMTIVAQAFRNGHWSVAISIIAGLIIKLLIIISTAMLWLEQGDYLVTQTFPLRVMESLLGLFTILVVTMLLSAPKSFQGRVPGTIAEMQYVLESSPAFAKSLRDSMSHSSSNLQELLSQHRYMATINHANSRSQLSIEPGSLSRAESPQAETVDVEKAISASQSSPESCKGWTPLPFLLRLAIISLIAGLGTLVELLHQRSRLSNGLFDHLDDDPRRYIWQMAPPAVGVCISILVGIIDHATRVAQPFLAVNVSGAKAHTGGHVNYMACLGPEAAFKAITRRHWPVALSASATTLGPMLTIASASLFFPDEIRGRLIQDTISTRVVESLLGSLFLLLVVGLFVGNVKTVAMHDPGSIAGMSLVLIGDGRLLKGMKSSTIIEEKTACVEARPRSSKIAEKKGLDGRVEGITVHAVSCGVELV